MGFGLKAIGDEHGEAVHVLAAKRRAGVRVYSRVRLII